MDSVLLSLSQSPLYQSLMTNANYDQFLYSMSESYAPMSKHKVEIPITKGLPLQSETLKLPRFGLLTNVYLRITVQAVGGDL